MHVELILLDPRVLSSWLILNLYLGASATVFTVWAVRSTQPSYSNGPRYQKIRKGWCDLWQLKRTSQSRVDGQMLRWERTALVSYSTCLGQTMDYSYHFQSNGSLEAESWVMVKLTLWQWGLARVNQQITQHLCLCISSHSWLASSCFP